MKERKSKIGGLAIVLAASLWGLDGIALTPRLYNLDTKFVVFMLHLLPFIGMNFIFYKEYRVLKKFTKYDYIFMTLIAVFGGAIGTLSIVKALFLLNFQHLTIITLLQKLQPVFAIVLARFILKEKITKKFVVWTIYAVVAAFAFGSSTVLGKEWFLQLHTNRPYFLDMTLRH